MIRKYEPELRSIPLTFLDCPDLSPVLEWVISLNCACEIRDTCNNRDADKGSCMNNRHYFHSCMNTRHYLHCCPRGFP